MVGGRNRRGKKRQTKLDLRTWGGKRKGAGRKPSSGRRRVSRSRRVNIPKGCPAHVTLRVREDISNLRTQNLMNAIRAVFWQARMNTCLRLTQFSVQPNHLHLIVEADDTASLSRGMQALCIRLALKINRTLGRRGRVFEDRFHNHVPKIPREVEHAIRYVMENSRIHAERAGRSIEKGIDPFTGGPCPVRFPREHRCLIVEPRCWLLRRAWNLPRKPPPVGPPRVEAISLFDDRRKVNQMAMPF